MPYTEQFGGTGEAYVKLPVYEASQKIKNGEITPEEADALSIMGAMVCLNSMMDESPLSKKLNDFEKFLVIKSGSTKGIEKSDLAVLTSFGRVIAELMSEEKLNECGELGTFFRKVDTFAKQLIKEGEDQSRNYESYMDQLEELGPQSDCFRGHAETLLALKPKYDMLADSEAAKMIDAFKTALEMYCKRIMTYCDLVESTRDAMQELVAQRKKKKVLEEKKKNDALKKELAEKNPREFMDEVAKISPEKRKEYIEFLDQNLPETDVDSFEKLLWLDETQKTATKLIARMKNFYNKNKSAGWLGNRDKDLAQKLIDAPKIPSRNIFWDLLIILASVALAVLVGFHPAVSGFFVSAMTPILAIITIAVFIIGICCGGFVVAVVATFVWLVVSYFINKLIPFETLLQIIAALALLIPGVLALGDIPTHSKKAVQEATKKRYNYYKDLEEECDSLRSYISAVTEKITAMGTEVEGVKSALKYYDGVKDSIKRTVKNIHWNLEK